MSSVTPGSQAGGAAGVRLDEGTAELIADIMFALSTPSRVQIVACLMGGQRSVGELVEELGFEQSAVSHQLRVLREHDLVRAERVGRRRVYALADEEVSVLLKYAIRRVTRPAAPPGRLRGAVARP